jgi:NAD(P)-dependent dehydrogenase (short-subunit alcohol dehydrogenase family)/acyl carrier protein
MAQSRPDVQYFTFDLGEMEVADLGLMKRMLQALMPQFAAGEILPPPTKTYPIATVSAAFRELSQARHRGKVVLALSRTASPEPAVRIRPEASYIVTGGLGGLGREVARWLVAQGARHLVLTGRQSADSPEKQAALQALTAAGAEVLVEVGDISNRADVERALAAARRSGPLRGVVHAAGVLRDGLLDQLTWDTFEDVMRPKTTGGWLLHTLTEPDELDFFVCFSSVASLIGSPGQANYAAANAFLDGLAHARRARQLPATSINWGPWAGTGMAARLDERDQQRMIESGWHMLTAEEGLDQMVRAMAGESAQVGVLPVDWRRFATSTGEVTPLLKEVAVEGAVPTADLLETFLATPPEDRRELLLRFVREQIAAVLAWESAEALEPRARLFDLGMDSLTAVEMQSRLQRGLGFALPRTLAFDYPTIEALVDFVYERLCTQSGSDALPQQTAAASDVHAADPVASADNSTGWATDNVAAWDNLSESEQEARLEDLSESEMEAILRTRLSELDR